MRIFEIALRRKRNERVEKIVYKYNIIRYIQKRYMLLRGYIINVYSIIVRNEGTRYKTFGIPKINLSTLFYNICNSPSTQMHLSTSAHTRNHFI